MTQTYRPEYRIPKRPRTCLRCNKKFGSTGPANRICPPCQQRNASQTGVRAYTKINDGFQEIGRE